MNKLKNKDVGNNTGKENKEKKVKEDVKKSKENATPQKQLTVVTKKKNKILRAFIKFIIIIFLIIASFIGSFVAGVYITNKDELKKLIYKFTSIELDDSTNQTNEIETNDLYELEDGTTNPEENLMENDMTRNESINRKS